MSRSPLCAVLAALTLLAAAALAGCGNDLDNFGNVHLAPTASNTLAPESAPTASLSPGNFRSLPQARPVQLVGPPTAP